MARHNRDGTGEDQRGRSYRISFQPDWLRQIKVTRTLESGRQSTKTLFRNGEPREDEPGPRVRTRVTSAEQGLDFEIAIEDPRQVVRRIIVETELPGGDRESSTITFSIEDDL